MERPRPVPWPTFLVVKNGSNIRSKMVSGIPGPVSLIAMVIVSGSDLVLRVIFFVLFCLDGEAYVHCKSIFPDEIMDLHGNILSSLPEIEQPICYEIRNEHESPYLIDRFLSFVLFTYKARICFPINNCYLLDSNARLFSLNRYNS